MDSEETTGIPEPPEAPTSPTGASPDRSVLDARAQRDYIVELKPLKSEAADAKRSGPKKTTLRWLGWAALVLSAITAVIGAVWILNNLVQHVHQSQVAPPGGNQQLPATASTNQQPPRSYPDPGWREPPWGLPVPPEHPPKFTVSPVPAREP